MFFNCVELQQGVQSKVGMVAWVHWRGARRTKRKRKWWTQFMIACSSLISFSSSTGWFQTRHRLYLTEAILQKQNDSSSRKIYHNFTGDFYLSHQKTLLQSRNLLNISKCDRDAFIWNISIWSWKAKNITLLPTSKSLLIHNTIIRRRGLRGGCHDALKRLSLVSTKLHWCVRRGRLVSWGQLYSEALLWVLFCLTPVVRCSWHSWGKKRVWSERMTWRRGGRWCGWMTSLPRCPPLLSFFFRLLTAPYKAKEY